jgi:hypothetical protein
MSYDPDDDIQQDPAGDVSPRTKANVSSYLKFSLASTLVLIAVGIVATVSGMHGAYVIIVVG